MFLLFSIKISFSQGSFSPLTLTDHGIFDHVYDRFGSEYDLITLSLNSARPGAGSSYSVSSTPTNVCTAGYFDLYFAAGSFFDTNPTAANVLCEVFKNISGFIASPLSVGSNTVNRINIYCANNALGTPTGMLASATGFYIMPYNPINSNGGVVYNQIQKALISGQDPFSNLPQTLFPGVNNFYHGYVYADPSYNWNVNMSLSSIASGDYDLYSVMLHEVVHALGFATLMNSSGGSVLGAGNNYYSIYDTFLKNSSGVSLLANSSGSCSASNLTFQGSPTAINPGSCTGLSSDISTCSVSAKYVSANVTSTVYTPNCFESGSSLSHFEDMCTVPSNFTTGCTYYPLSPGYNNLYFVMSNATGTGNCYIKRYLKPEERYVLCDLGYSVNTTYTSTAANASFNYGGSICPGKNIWGNHDGMGGTGYTLTSSGTTFSVLISSLLANDAPSATQMSCIEIVYNNTASFSTLSSSLIVTAVAGSGLVVLKYLPKSNSNELGNPTYVYIYFISGSCSPNTCNMVQNAGFESVSSISSFSCGQMGIDVFLDCWDQPNSSPDYYRRNCTSGIVFNLGMNTVNSNPVINSHNGTPNDGIAGTAATSGGMSNGFTTELLRNNLSAPLIPGQLYQFSIWAYHPQTLPLWGITQNAPIVFNVWADVSVTNILNINFQSALPKIAQFTLTSGVWTQFTNTFVFAPTTGTLNHNAIIIGVNSQMTGSLSSNTGAYPFFDDLLLTPVTATSPAFYIPNANNCGNTTFTNLAQYTNFPGTFSGPGVTSSGSGTNTVYNFYSSSAGIYPVAFSFTNNGCANLLSQNIVVQAPFTVVPSCDRDVYCTNASPNQPAITMSVTATTTNSAYYTWYPGGMVGNTVSLVPSANTTYTVYALAGCVVSETLALKVSSACCTSTLTQLTNSMISTYSISTPVVVNSDISIPPGQVLTLSSAEFAFAPDVKIIVNNGANLTVKNSHLYACSNEMWQGIVVKDGGEVTLTYENYENLIEDAKTAVKISSQFTTNSNYVLTAERTTFNRNFIDIEISDYQRNSSSYPFSISRCVFTSRNFTFSPTVWIQAIALLTPSTVSDRSSPFLLQNTAISNLKPPYATQPSQTAIKLTNVGSTQTNTIYAIEIGPVSTGSTSNLFDYHNKGIDCINSNVKSYNNTFQNTQIIDGSTGIGIKSVNNYGGTYFNTSLDLTSPSSPSNNINRFYNCHTGINTKNLAFLDVQYATFQSTQSSTATPTSNDIGRYGIFISSNRFYNYVVSRNGFYNVNTGINGFVTDGLTGLTSTVTTFGQSWGSVNINNNTFSVTSSSNEYMNNGIVIQTINKGISSTAFTQIAPVNGLRIQYNNFDGVWRGVQVSNFNNMLFNKITADNTFSLAADVNNANKQYGVEYINCVGGIINSNYVRGFTTNTVVNLQGVSLSMCGNTGVQCNSLVTLPIGTEFNGTNSTTRWCNNRMNNNSRGMQLSNNGVIGAQGSANYPQDNVWEGTTWSSSNYCTYTDLSSLAAFSPITARTVGTGLYPSFNSGVVNANSYNGNILPGNNGSAALACITVGPVRGIAWGWSKKGLAIGIAQRIIPHWDQNEDESIEINDFLLFRDLHQDTTLRESSDTLLDFYDSNKSSAIGQLMDISEKLEIGDFSSANSAISSFTVNSDIEQNYLDFYTIYNHFLEDGGTLDSEDSIALSILSSKCPFLDGPIIYNSRALYNLFTSQNVQYNDVGCITDESLRKVPSKRNNNIDKYLIFPNPAIDEVQISGINEKELIKVIVSDLNGRKIFDQERVITDYKTSLKFKLVDGVYLVTLINQDHERTVKKLVIAK